MGILHIYLPLSQFSPSRLGANIDESGIGALSYESAFEDPLLAENPQMPIASELQETQTFPPGIYSLKLWLAVWQQG